MAAADVVAVVASRAVIPGINLAVPVDEVVSAVRKDFRILVAAPVFS